MDNKPAQNIQDTFLNTVRKDKTPITIYLVSGVKLTGKIRSFDKYSVLLENNSQEQLIFKHAISTVVSNRSVIHSEHRPLGAVSGHPSAAPGSCMIQATRKTTKPCTKSSRRPSSTRRPHRTSCAYSSLTRRSTCRPTAIGRRTRRPTPRRT